jgi:hypothetical protein
MKIEKLHITLYTIPQAACDQKKMSWTDVASLLKNQMEHFFQNKVVFEHIEFMSGNWFADENAQTLLEKGEANFPFVLVNGEVGCSEKKVNISKIRRFAELKINSLTIKNSLPN